MLAGLGNLNAKIILCKQGSFTLLIFSVNESFFSNHSG